jgi:quercetin dioxygenase-like cupin family protein
VAKLGAEELQELLAALRRAFEAGFAREDAIGAEIRAVTAALGRAPREPTFAEAAGHPVTRHLPAALSLAAESTPEVTAAARSVAAFLPWKYGYRPRQDAPGLESVMGWAEIVGPAAPFQSTEVCFGLTLIGPGAYYPPHRHPAVELYHVLAGRAAWSAGAGTAINVPGAYILHTASTAHSMRTGSEPLLAIYSWTGDVNSPSVWADPPGSC